MRSIAEICIFKTPFEKTEQIADKFRKVQEMLMDYSVNSWVSFLRSEHDSGTFRNIVFQESHGLAKITFSFRTNFSNFDFLPVGLANFELEDMKLEKRFIESFLDDVVKFFANVFHDAFFLDIDRNFHIASYVKWAKQDPKALTEFDLDHPWSDKNKKFLDYSLYLYFSLLKNALHLDRWEVAIQALLNNNTIPGSPGFSENLLLSKERQDEVKKMLLRQMEVVRLQIEHFISILS